MFSGGLAHTRLIYVTGRGAESVIPLLSDSTLPQPDYIIADVGATVLHGDLRPVSPLHHDIAAGWPGTQVILQRLAKFPLLRRIPARLIGIGFRAEHVRTPEAHVGGVT